MAELGLENWQDYRPLLATLAAIPLLLWLVLKWKIPAFTALIGVSLIAALAAGMSSEAAYATITAGMGGTLGFIAVIVGLGSLFGALLEAGGGLPRLARLLLGERRGFGGQLMTGMIGLVVAIPVFFDVALIVLAPVVVALARRAGRPVLAFGLPLLAGLAIAHAFIPPTPGPVAVADILGADLAWVIQAGLAAGIPALLVAGPVFANALERFGQMPEARLGHDGVSDEIENAVSGRIVLLLILLPLVLILTQAVLALTGVGGAASDVFALVGHPFAALLIGCAIAGLVVANKPQPIRDRVSRGIAEAFAPAGAVILVTGAGGAFKQVLVDTGAGAQLAGLVLAFGMTPILLGYALALIVRVAQGSATVAMITAAGMTAPLLIGQDLGGFDVALIVIAIAAGASALSHVNDSGFWLVSRIFGLSEAATLKTWTVSSTLLSITGLFACLALSLLA
ncbi:gluconate:H+ symporter [Maricaulis sp. MIT060901]|uniref:GntT/GntP/DsdX family permease n=1 Tax=Maricaulis sp. MIT060901 TaxID=3096993 RepID=UPI0039998766